MAMILSNYKILMEYVDEHKPNMVLIMLSDHGTPYSPYRQIR